MAPSAPEALRSALVSGSPLKGICALYAVASLTVLPLTWRRAYYSFSVGYGLAVSTMSSALLCSFAFSEPEGKPDARRLTRASSSPAPSIAALTALAYGLRLAAFLKAREGAVKPRREAYARMDATPRLKRTPLALGISLLYAFMVSPVLFALRGANEAGSLSEGVQAFFAGVALFGAILESVADQHKFRTYESAKRPSGKEGEEDKFVGPTTWSYGICRHPNYLGEILHWVGLFGVGLPSFGNSIAAWVCGILGLAGILSIMFTSSSRLDRKQAEKYGGQQAFDEWRARVAASVIPFVR